MSMTFQRFTKGFIEVEAIQVPAVGNNHWLQVGLFIGGNPASNPLRQLADGTIALEIETPEGPQLAVPGDWIIRGIDGRLGICKPERFKAAYEAVWCGPNGDD